jgi:nucleotide-binding universal stress UspA family protein
MRWLVGFDPTPSSVGVVRLAAWLHARTDGKHVLHGVYVDTSPATGFADGVGSGPPLTAAERAARAFLVEQGVADAFAHVEALHGAPDKVLQALAEERELDGLLVGRAAPVEREELVSLGRVPRRLLRRLELPTVVVPPDRGDPGQGALMQPNAALGPIVVGVTPTRESLEAAGFAVLLGKALALPVVLVHVVERSRPALTTGVLSLEPRDPIMRTSDIVPPMDTSGPAASIGQWAARSGLEDLPLELRVGHVPVELVALAREHHATMIVCGSRRLSLLERVFTSSVGSELAAHADRPVVVVPSGGRT